MKGNREGSQQLMTGPTSESTVGLDLGDRWSRYCVIDSRGVVAKEDRVRTRPEAMEETFRLILPSKMVIEAGTHLLVQAAQYILGPLAPDSRLRRWGMDLSRRINRGSYLSNEHNRFVFQIYGHAAELLKEIKAQYSVDLLLIHGENLRQIHNSNPPFLPLPVSDLKRHLPANRVSHKATTRGASSGGHQFRRLYMQQFRAENGVA